MENDGELGQELGHLFEYVEAQLRFALELERAVAGAYRYRERVDARLSDELRRFLGIGVQRVGIGDLYVVLDACEPAELGFDYRAVIMRVFDYLRGYLDVFRKGMRGGVYHDGGEAVVDAVYAKIVGIAVIEVETDRETGILDGSLDHFDEIFGIGVLARARRYLQYKRSFFELARLDDALDRFHVVDVERADGVAAFIGFCEHILSRY